MKFGYLCSRIPSFLYLANHMILQENFLKMSIFNFIGSLPRCLSSSIFTVKTDISQPPKFLVPQTTIQKLFKNQIFS